MDWVNNLLPDQKNHIHITLLFGGFKYLYTALKHPTIKYCCLLTLSERHLHHYVSCSFYSPVLCTVKYMNRWYHGSFLAVIQIQLPACSSPVAFKPMKQWPHHGINPIHEVINSGTAHSAGSDIWNYADRSIFLSTHCTSARTWSWTIREALNRMISHLEGTTTENGSVEQICNVQQLKICGYITTNSPFE